MVFSNSSSTQAVSAEPEILQTQNTFSMDCNSFLRTAHLDSSYFKLKYTNPQSKIIKHNYLGFTVYL